MTDSSGGEREHRLRHRGPRFVSIPVVLLEDAAKRVLAAGHALLITRITAGSASGNSAVHAKYAERESLGKKIKRARRRLRDAERAVAWAQLLFWRRRREIGRAHV